MRSKADIIDQLIDKAAPRVAVVLSFLQNGCRPGNLGTITPGELGEFFVTVEGRAFTVRTCRLGWSVTLGDYEGVDRVLGDAARLALNP